MPIDKKGFTKMAEVTSKQIFKRSIWLESIANKPSHQLQTSRARQQASAIQDSHLVQYLCILSTIHKTPWIFIGVYCYHMQKEHRFYHSSTVSIFVLNFNKWYILAFSMSKLTSVIDVGFLKKNFFFFNDSKSFKWDKYI